uniref:Uncharacterized protein n=1 Tax=Anguilla anguilla TaxID=7936 RepID=A0A0E9U4N0_ANGAN
MKSTNSSIPDQLGRVRRTQTMNLRTCGSRGPLTRPPTSCPESCGGLKSCPSRRRRSAH